MTNKATKTKSFARQKREILALMEPELDKGPEKWNEDILLELSDKRMDVQHNKQVVKIKEYLKTRADRASNKKNTTSKKIDIGLSKPSVGIATVEK